MNRDYWDDEIRNLKDRIEQLEAALLDIFDHELRTSNKSFIACTAREALWPNDELGKNSDD